MLPFKVEHVDMGSALSSGKIHTGTDGLMSVDYLCPRCEHSATAEFALQDVPLPGGAGVQAMSGNGSSIEVVPVDCNCQHEHPGRGDGLSGCGATDAVEVTT